MELRGAQVTTIGRCNSRAVCVGLCALMRRCVCLLLVRARAKIKGNKYGATLLSLLSTRFTSRTVPPIVVTRDPLEWTGDRQAHTIRVLPSVSKGWTCNACGDREFVHDAHSTLFCRFCRRDGQVAPYHPLWQQRTRWNGPGTVRPTRVVCYLPKAKGGHAKHVETRQFTPPFMD